MQADQVPVIDLSPFATTTASAPTADQLKVASQLRDACETVGFFYIKGHGCSPSITQDMMKATNAFFDLPLDAKMELEANKNPLWRGYNSLEKGAHSCTPQDKNKPRDHKESFTIGAEPSMGVSPMHGPNQWPKLPDFETSARQYWNALKNPVATRLMQALALSLDLDMDFFVTKSQTSPHPQMVLLRYPPAAPAQEDDDPATGCGAHTDCGFLTILTQDQPGLQVQHANGTWVDAPPIPDAFVVNLGDMMAHWTNDRYKSTLHRVRNPTAGIRHSIPFFWTVDYDTRIEPIPSCVQGGESAVYQPTTSGHYILGKLGLMYLAGKEDEPATTTNSSSSSCKRSADDATMPLSTMEEKKPRKIAAQN